MPAFVRHFPTSKTKANTHRLPKPELDLALYAGLGQGNQYELDRARINWARRMVNIPRTREEEPLHVFLNEPSIEAL